VAAVSAPVRVWMARVWALLLGTSVVYFFTNNQADNDLWGHVLFGRDILAAAAVPHVDTYAYTAAGHPWVDHEWLSQVLLAAVYDRGGAAGLLLLKTAVGMATFLFLLGRIRRRTTTVWVWGGVGLLAIAVLARGFAIRPQIFTYCGVALTLWLLDRAQRGALRALWWFPALFVAWANLHGGFILGLAILGLFACAGVLQPAGPRWRPWIVWLAAIALTALNPYGPRLLFYVWSELSRVHPITEWRPASPRDVSHLVFFALLGLFVGTLAFFRGWRERGWEVLLALAIGVLAVRQQRHTPVFALCVVAPLTVQLEQAATWLHRRLPVALSPAAHRLIGLSVATLALLQIALTGLRLQRDGLRIVFDPAEYPTAAVQVLRQARVHGNMAVPLDWGEYVLWFLAPQIRVSLDGRFATVFSERIVEENFDFFSGAPGWRRLVDQYPTEAALVPVGSPCPIGQLSGWQRAYGDRVAEIYVRADRANAFELPAVPAAVSSGVFP
jgi:hypothetical protein